MNLEEIKAIAKKHQSKLEKIKLLAVDCDGIMTDGRLFWDGEEVGFNRWFSTADGYAFKVMPELGIDVAIISGGDSIGLKKRIENLKIKHYYLGKTDKREAFNDLKQKLSLNDDEIAYVGDELFDMPLLDKAGFSATVPEAAPEVLKVVDHITHVGAGYGAVREVADLIRHAQNLVVPIPGF